MVVLRRRKRGSKSNASGEDADEDQGFQTSQATADEESHPATQIGADDDLFQADVAQSGAAVAPFDKVQTISLDGDETPAKKGERKNGYENKIAQIVTDPEPEAEVTASEPGAKTVSVPISTADKVSSSLPLVCAPKVDDKVVFAVASDLSFDLSGDVGAVGRVSIVRDKLSFDLKGVIYDSRRVASNTLCVVTVGDTDAKLQAMSDEYLALSESVELQGGEKVTRGTLDFMTVEDNVAEGDPDELFDPKDKRKRPREGDVIEKSGPERPKKKATPRKKSDSKKKQASSAKSRGKRKPSANK